MNFLKQAGWGALLVRALVLEMVRGGKIRRGRSSFLMNSYLEFVWRVLFLCLICVYARQLLWRGGALRRLS